MKSAVFATLATAILGVSAAPAAPAKRATSAIDDTTVLNFALTLEHLENAFYSGALAKFSEADFASAGMPAYSHGRFVEIGQHEAAHVKFLSAALGANATQPCNYTFPYTDPKSFAALSMTLEGVGVSAYTGAAQYITSKAYLTAAASVLSTEARHASWVAGVVDKQAPWSGPFDVPLGLDSVYSLAAAFITSCPSSNPVLPVKAFPTLAFPASAAPGAKVTLTFDQGNSTGTLYAAFYTGTGAEYAKIDASDKSVTIPKDLVGTVYAVVTTNGTMSADTNTVAGVAVLDFSFDSNGKLLA
ncbi:hypothetical protein FIBSPDRAFT_804701 [Athelia psychrophila]|uniref:Ferritin-like domain-containing protein n=1 Tax=Athelia psychrophila TaxID=1759441 RepID=A0A167WZ91_9AGAM|nr:hypothetical protein FIBSPDRAFT_804701 [Fibularhizoctonia sp. CBS 109695]